MRRGPTEKVTVTTASEEGTKKFGFSLGSDIEDGVCVSLTGPLGAGKSVLVRGMCRGLGVEEEVLSPTFVLYEEYDGRLPVIHCDLYRLDHESEIEALGIFDCIGGDAVLLAEWGDRSPRLTEAADIVVSIRITGESERSIEVVYK